MHILQVLWRILIKYNLYLLKIHNTNYTCNLRQVDDLKPVLHRPNSTFLKSHVQHNERK